MLCRLQMCQITIYERDLIRLWRLSRVVNKCVKIGNESIIYGRDSSNLYLQVIIVQTSYTKYSGFRGALTNVSKLLTNRLSTDIVFAYDNLSRNALCDNDEMAIAQYLDDDITTTRFYNSLKRWRWHNATTIMMWQFIIGFQHRIIAIPSSYYCNRK